MKYILAIAVLLLSACTTVVPVKQQFPVAPSILLEKCPQLQKVDSDRGTMREMLRVVIENYATYYQCAAKTHGWQDWYQEQKKTYEDVE
jgi:Zn-finger nucleic acid-binding protein